MDDSDWLNVQTSNDMLGTHPKGGHSASSFKWHNQKEHPSTYRLGWGKEEHELYIQTTEVYIRGTSTLHVRVITKGQKMIVISIGDNYHLRLG